jgi:hypothetical protein
VKSFSNTSNLPLAQAPTLRRGLVALHLRTWSRWPGRLGSRPLLKIIVVRQRTLAPALPPEATLSATWGRAGGGGGGGGEGSIRWRAPRAAPRVGRGGACVPASVPGRKVLCRCPCPCSWWPSPHLPPATGGGREVVEEGEVK